MKKEHFLDSWLKCGALVTTHQKRLLLGWGPRRYLHDPYECRNIDQPRFYFPDFFLKDEFPWFVHEYHLEIDPQHFLTLLTSHLSSPMTSYNWEHLHAPIFEKEFHKLKNKLDSLELQKAVLYSFQTSLETMSSTQLMKSVIAAVRYQIASEFSAVYSYGCWDRDEGLLGVTPELLFSVISSNQIDTMACAGTRAKYSTALPLMQDLKQLKEHQLVVHGIQKSFEEIGQVDIGETSVMALPQLEHLVTPMSINCYAASSFSTVIKALHPTPALGAFPKASGKQWLEEYQKLIPRKRFGAPVGYVWPCVGRNSCYVAIRNVQWDSQHMFIGAGCGVVAESTFTNEWEEINLKLASIKEILAL